MLHNNSDKYSKQIWKSSYHLSLGDDDNDDDDDDNTKQYQVLEPTIKGT